MSAITKRIFLIGSLLVTITGAVMLAGVNFADDYEMMFITSGALVLFLGIILLISGFLSPVVAESSRGRMLGAFLIVGSLIGIVGVLTVYSTYGMVMIGGAILILIAFLAWPCVCIQGGRGARSQVVGVASAHDRISISEIAGITGLSEQTVRSTVYDAIGKKHLLGKMEGDTFVRSESAQPTYTAPGSTTREREVVKVLVICPFCGAKTEQGLSKCQNCGADL